MAKKKKIKTKKISKTKETAREKSKESEKHHFQAQNDLILTIFGQNRAN